MLCIIVVRIRLSQPHFAGNIAPRIFLNGGIVFPRRIDVFMAEHIGDDVNIFRLPVQLRAVGTAQLMRGDLFKRRNKFTVLFYKVFDRTDADAPHF